MLFAVEERDFDFQDPNFLSNITSHHMVPFHIHENNTTCLNVPL